MKNLVTPITILFVLVYNGLVEFIEQAIKSLEYPEIVDNHVNVVGEGEGVRLGVVEGVVVGVIEGTADNDGETVGVREGVAVTVLVGVGVFVTLIDTETVGVLVGVVVGDTLIVGVGLVGIKYAINPLIEQSFAT